MRSTMLLAGMAVAALFAAAPASAETVQYKATIMPATEVPPVTNSKATGDLAATYDTTTKVLTYTATYSGLTGPATMAHFHGPAPVGKNAGVMVPIKGDLASPIKGTATLTDEQAKALTSGDMYFNIHTAANKAGEMRGQVVK
ncbi:MAG: CHRD domain-containing protein [Janthinobacterium lividum]